MLSGVNWTHLAEDRDKWPRTPCWEVVEWASD
jgi:hypothetical protein